MKSLARLMVSGMNLIESEGRVLRGQVLRSAVGVAGIVVAATVFLLSLIAVLLAAFLAFRVALGDAGALLAISAMGFAICALLFWSLSKWLPLNFQADGSGV